MNLFLVLSCFSWLFSLRAAQKLNLASKKKKQKTAAVTAPVTSSSPSCDPPLFPTNFSSALLMAPPPAPPCLLRAANKIKDTPGLGKVKRGCLLFGCRVQIHKLYLKSFLIHANRLATLHRVMCSLEQRRLTSNYFGYSFILMSQFSSWMPGCGASLVALFCLNRVNFCCFSIGWKLIWQIVCDLSNFTSVQQTSQLSWHILYVQKFISYIISYSTSSSWFKHMRKDKLS